MTRRALAPERAEALRVATAQAVLAYLRKAGVNVPSSVLAQGLATALAEMLGKHVNVKHRAEVIARCMSIVGTAERKR